MKRAIVVAMMLAAATALAAPAQLVTPPAGWRPDPEQAAALAQRFAATGQLGGLPVVTAAEAYVADRPGVALFATRATATLAEPAQAAGVARAALDELRASARRAGLTGGAAQEQSWDERVDAEHRQVTASLMWSDPASHAVAARIVVASDGARITAVTGECLASGAAEPSLMAACRSALASLDPGVAAASRVELVPARASQAAQAPASAGGAHAAPRGGGGAASAAPPRIDDGERVVFPPTRIPQEPRAADRRPVFLGAGLIALALMFWWNRRRRDRFEREDQPSPPRRRRATRTETETETDDDADADDLHAAARGERSDAPDRRE